MSMRPVTAALAATVLLAAACNDTRIPMANLDVTPVDPSDTSGGDDTNFPDFDAPGGGPDGGPFDPDGGPFDPDGGPFDPDGGPFDPDGGPFDPDGGPVDGGPVDPDGGPFDPDGGPVDGGPVDPDGGPIDGGPIDGGPVDPDGGPADVTPDIIADTTPDAIADTTPDAIADTTPDAIADTTPDAIADTTPDAIADTTPDAIADTTPDAIADTTPDAIADTTPDAIADTTPDAIADADVAPDVPVDVTPDADVDAGPLCGNGRIEPGEECDDGARNSNTRPNACRLDCTLARCGDGVVDAGEACDDGNDDDFDGCDRACNLILPTPCEPCVRDADCGRRQDICRADATGQSVCLTGCASNADCPEDFACTARDGGRYCVPASGSCTDCIDADGDGYGIGTACLGPDCDDTNPTIFPGAPEICDGLDNNCNGTIDEGVQRRWFRDNDGDGFAGSDTVVFSCTRPGPEYFERATDCDDRNAQVFPGAPEVCTDGLDNNCNLLVDCDDPACAASCGPADCVDGEFTGVGANRATGTTVGAGDDFAGTCGGTGAPEVALRYTAPGDGTYTFRSNGSAFPTVLYLRPGCEGPQIACNAVAGTPNASVSAQLLRGQSVVLFVDGQTRAQGNYAISVNRSEAGFCADGVDNDGNGAIDCADAACTFDPICCPDDIFEPNQGTAAAPATTLAQFQANSNAVLTVRPDDPDFFNLPVCRGAQVRVEATFAHANGNINLALLTPQGVQVAQANSTTDNELLTFTVPNIPGVPERLFLRVVNATPQSCNSYRLSIRVTGC